MIIFYIWVYFILSIICVNQVNNMDDDMYNSWKELSIYEKMIAYIFTPILYPWILDEIK